MADNQRYQRDVRGRFTKIDVERDVLAPDLGVPQTFAYNRTPRFAPAGDDLAQGGESSPPGVRTARMIGTQRDAGGEIYATPRAETMRGAHTGAAGRTPGAEMTYITGDIDQSAPGESALHPYGAPLPPDARLRVDGDEESRGRYGIQGALTRDAARNSGDPMDASRYLTGADDGR